MLQQVVGTSEMGNKSLDVVWIGSQLQHVQHKLNTFIILNDWKKIKFYKASALLNVELQWMKVTLVYIKHWYVVSPYKVCTVTRQKP